MFYNNILSGYHFRYVYFYTCLCRLKKKVFSVPGSNYTVKLTKLEVRLITKNKSKTKINALIVGKNEPKSNWTYIQNKLKHIIFITSF